MKIIKSICYYQVEYFALWFYKSCKNSIYHLVQILAYPTWNTTLPYLTALGVTPSVCSLSVKTTHLTSTRRSHNVDGWWFHRKFVLRHFFFLSEVVYNTNIKKSLKILVAIVQLWKLLCTLDAKKPTSIAYPRQNKVFLLPSEKCLFFSWNVW